LIKLKNSASSEGIYFRVHPAAESVGEQNQVMDPPTRAIGDTALVRRSNRAGDRAHSSAMQAEEREIKVRSAFTNGKPEPPAHRGCARTGNTPPPASIPTHAVPDQHDPGYC
jgi:hypothetical protein